MLKKILRWVALAVVAALAMLAAASVTPANAQETADQGGGRKVKSRIAPVYPNLAKQMKLGGSVKVEVVIAPSGTVKSAKALGGHPVLIESALDAIKRWKYEPGAGDSTQVVEFKFSPGA